MGAAARPLWRSRAAVVVIAVAADAIAWMVATAGGVDLEVGLPGQAPREVTLVNVLVMTVLFSVLGWAARAVLDRIAKPRAAAIWLAGAAVVLLLSLFPQVAMEATAGPRSR